MTGNTFSNGPKTNCSVLEQPFDLNLYLFRKQLDILKVYLFGFEQNPDIKLFFRRTNLIMLVKAINIFIVDVSIYYMAGLGWGNRSNNQSHE